MRRVTESEVIIYHDETGGAGEERLNGHVLLFVPVKVGIEEKRGLFGPSSYQIDSQRELFKQLEGVRGKFQAYYKFHFKGIGGQKWVKYNEAEKQWVKIGVEALRGRYSKGSIFPYPLYCKLGVIFYEAPPLESLKLYRGDTKKEKGLRYHETLLRMLLKGAVHYLYNENHKVKILKIITDGEPSHRKLSEDRILWRLIEEELLGKLRGYVEIKSDTEIVHLPSDHKNHEVGTEEYVHANMLQLADMLLGSVRHVCFKKIKVSCSMPKIGRKVENKKSVISYPVKEMLDKRKRGENFRYSSHYRSFTISKAFIRDSEWKFQRVITREIQLIPDLSQVTLLKFSNDERGMVKT